MATRPWCSISRRCPRALKSVTYRSPPVPRFPVDSRVAPRCRRFSVTYGKRGAPPAHPHAIMNSERPPVRQRDPASPRFHRPRTKLASFRHVASRHNLASFRHLASIPKLASFRHFASIPKLASFRHNCVLPSVSRCRSTLLPEEIHLHDYMGLMAQNGANSPAPEPIGLCKLLKYRTHPSGIWRAFILPLCRPS